MPDPGPDPDTDPTPETLEDGRVRYYRSTDVVRDADGAGRYIGRYTAPAPAGTPFETAAAASESFRLTDADIGRHPYREHIAFRGPGGRSAFSHYVHHFPDGSEATHVFLRPRHATGVAEPS